MKDYSKMTKKGNSFYLEGEEVPAYFQDGYDCVEAYKVAGVKGYDPMLAKELETEEAQDMALNYPENIIEEKFDGTRGILQCFSVPTVDENGKESTPWSYARIFSRNVSKKTGFYTENTDSLPHIRDTDVPELAGTVLDGELFINGQPFEEVSSTLNCLWDKAVARQLEKGLVSFHAFDIIKYHGIDLRKLPLHRRKEYLHFAVEEANSKYIEEVPYYQCGEFTNLDWYEAIYDRVGGEYKAEEFISKIVDLKDTYKDLYKCISLETNLTPRAYYELIVATGGEGVIVKNHNGKYRHMRGWEYSKIKKFLTRDLILYDFVAPTVEYTGKDIKKWGYWQRESDGAKLTGNFYNQKGYIPVTKYHFLNQVGTMKLGVLISDEEIAKLPKNKKFIIHEDTLPKYGMKLLEVCECAGYNEEDREYFTRHQDELIGTVIEVKANDIFKDTGKLRHPRYMRRRFDKEPEQCTWSDHVNKEE